jgi:hypothetical protein
MAKRGKRANPADPGPGKEIPDVVPHPRYGTAVVPSGCTATEEEVRGSYYGYRGQTIYPESAIPADFSRQNFSTFPRGHYVDILQVCRACRRPFLFFAREQQFWYEELHFYIDTDCQHCPECRREQHEFRERLRRYSERAGRASLTNEELATLVGDAVFLWRAGVLHDESRLRGLRNRARRSILIDPATTSIDRLIASLPRSK